jgi:D-aminoacyl-tRNA deacylase
MRAVVQRALSARVEVEGQVIGRIDRGLVVFVGAGEDDERADLEYTVNKVVNLRVFPDESGRMTKALKDVDGALLVISQFTVFGDVRRGLRPSFDGAMEPTKAESIYDEFVTACRAAGVRVETGKFRADMRVFVENDGPVTILLDSKRLF